VFVGAWTDRLEAWNRHLQHSEPPAAPAQGQVSATFYQFEIEYDFFQQRAQQFLAITIGGRGRGSHLANVVAELL
jgi:hypothetical protein